MATEGSFGLIGSSSYELPRAPFLTAIPGSGTVQTLASWALARVVDGGREATFTVEADERFARLRRVHGATASMIECRLSAPMTAADLVQALARWAPSHSLAARVLPETSGAARISLSLPTD